MEPKKKSYFLQILERYRGGNASPEEIRFLEAYYNLYEDRDDAVTDANEHDYALLKDRMHRNVLTAVDGGKALAVKPAARLKWQMYSGIAAILLLTLSLAIYFLNNGKDPLLATAQIDENIRPGGNKAILTLAGGRKIVLDDRRSGEIARQAGIRISGTGNGQLVYTVAPENVENEGPVPEHAISTPNGGQYQVVLPDGTSVYLNSASTLTFPAVFRGSERVVGLRGEAYFEVSKDPSHPFRVKSGTQTVEVMGTHFNINAYEDEPSMRTTLVEGAVKVYAGTGSLVLAPGQQASVSRSEKNILVRRNADLEKELAWKNGLFSFEGDHIKDIMRNIARWYDVDIEYEGELPDIDFTGQISRQTRLSEVIRILELYHLRIKVSGKTLSVSYHEPQNTNRP